MKTKMEQILSTLHGEYAGKMSEKTIKRFAGDLYESLFVDNYYLADIFAIVEEYENMANIKDSQALYIFICMIDLLDNNEVNAKRLYNSFMHEIQLWDTFVKLIEDNAEYLSGEELEEVKNEGMRIFDKQLLKDIGLIA